MKKAITAALLWCGCVPIASEARDWPDAGGWSIGESDDFCMMFQEYEGKGDTNLSVAIKIDGHAMAHISNWGWSAQKDQEYEITWQLFGAASYSGPAYGTGDKYASRKGFTSGFPPEFVDSFAKATSLRVMRGDIVVDQLSLKGTAAAVAMTRKCVAHIKSLRAAEQREKDRLSYIADDPFSVKRTDAEKKVYGDLKPTPESWSLPWVTLDDYPSTALREGREGKVGFSLTISPEGRVNGCQVKSSSGHPDLDSETCKILSRRARFQPITGGGVYENNMDWKIPTPPD